MVHVRLIVALGHRRQQSAHRFRRALGEHGEAAGGSGLALGARCRPQARASVLERSDSGGAAEVRAEGVALYDAEAGTPAWVAVDAYAFGREEPARSLQRGMRGD